MGTAANALHTNTKREGDFRSMLRQRLSNICKLIFSSRTEGESEQHRLAFSTERPLRNVRKLRVTNGSQV